MGICYYCGKEVELPFKCSYCHLSFCDDHRLPEQHNCIKLPKRSWATYRRLKSRFYTPKKHKPITAKTPIQKQPESFKPIIIKQPPRTKRRGGSKKLLILLSIIGVSIIVFLAQYPNPEIAINIESTINNFQNSILELLRTNLKSVENITLPKAHTISSVNITEIDKLILKYTNIERKNNGLNELIWDENLSQIAREHSKDMAENGFFSHINPKGEDPTDRARRHEYRLHKELGGGWYTEGIAENIGKMPIGNVMDIGPVYNNSDSIAQAQVKSWMDSEGHRQNILDPNYDRLGVGTSYDDPWYISTQNFW